MSDQFLGQEFSKIQEQYIKQAIDNPTSKNILKRANKL